MESDGPYKLVGGVFEGPNGFNFRIVWGPDFKLDDKIILEEIIKVANQSYAAGRKAAEKDFHYDELSLKYLVDRHESLVDAFKELLALAQELCDDLGDDVAEKFRDWKKARGIENRIRGGQDGNG